MRKEFEMTQAQYDKLLEACRPVPYMVFGGMEPRSPQQNANDAWIALGEEMGFEGMSAQSIPGKPRCFTAEVKIGTEEGQICNRDGCTGVMIYIKDRPCTCHTGNPPCSACTDAPLQCPECGENA
ncbi:MAG: hypothetical protein WC482_04975 [Candidatus Omnitrophota bacterium]